MPIRPLGRLVANKNRSLAKSFRRKNAKHNEDRQKHDLRDLKRGSDCVGAIAFSAGTLLEELHELTRNISGKGDHSAIT